MRKISPGETVCLTMNPSRSAVAVLLSLLLLFLGRADAGFWNSNSYLSFLGSSEKPTPSSTTTTSSNSKSPNAYSIMTRVVNAFPPSGKDNSRMTLYLDEDKIQGVGYGKVNEKETVLHKVEDFVIDFKHPKTGAVVHGPAKYGYMGNEVGMGDEVLVIVRRNKKNPQKPTNDILKFPPLPKELSTKTTAETNPINKVYLYNAVWSTHPMFKGLNFYQHHERTGVLSMLTMPLRMGKGAEVSLPSGKSINIKASHANLEGKHDSAMARIIDIKFFTVPGKRQYVVVMGDQNTKNITALIMGGKPPRSSAENISRYFQTHSLLLITVLVFLITTQ